MSPPSLETSSQIGLEACLLGLLICHTDTVVAIMLPLFTTASVSRHTLTDSLFEPQCQKYV